MHINQELYQLVKLSKKLYGYEFIYTSILKPYKINLFLLIF